MARKQTHNVAQGQGRGSSKSHNVHLEVKTTGNKVKVRVKKIRPSRLRRDTKGRYIRNKKKKVYIQSSKTDRELINKLLSQQRGVAQPIATPTEIAYIRSIQDSNLKEALLKNAHDLEKQTREKIDKLSQAQAQPIQLPQPVPFNVQALPAPIEEQEPEPVHVHGIQEMNVRLNENNNLLIDNNNRITNLKGALDDRFKQLMNTYERESQYNNTKYDNQKREILIKLNDRMLDIDRKLADLKDQRVMRHGDEQHIDKQIEQLEQQQGDAEIQYMTDVMRLDEQMEMDRMTLEVLKEEEMNRLGTASKLIDAKIERVLSPMKVTSYEFGQSDTNQSPLETAITKIPNHTTRVKVEKEVKQYIDGKQTETELNKQLIKDMDEPMFQKPIVMKDIIEEAKVEREQKQDQMMMRRRIQDFSVMKLPDTVTVRGDILKHILSYQQGKITSKALERELNKSMNTVKGKRDKIELLMEDSRALNKEIKGSGNVGKGLYDHEIDKMMEPWKEDGYVGTVPADRVDKLPIKDKMSFIMNLNKSNQPGSHWVACNIDADCDKSVEYYDSFGDDPSDDFMKRVKVLIDRIDPDTYLKMKINKIVDQAANSDTCGWFCIKYLINRFNNVPWKVASGYSEPKSVRKGEKEVRKLKELAIKYGYI
ncbi:hypothetical protein SAMD00019534_043610 [Acytostelium subglobosum LB1]|uniref:hypothetical protein n=1 Tax=Acytostelium subglobosum LB1 TaxID=1410327 RepID=UPI0006448525|nr:hypothetical protein SAMD00019534_043610 [Acytostelium subglobosum LB1]GAM21186.1 hypothetical protein SAMD00019534_043610 [Acytostelium subglobosum LB1]|eukprot:XP_012756320.1 hypothetical protein SAMD00019534_043610 [Acytostelium subglobosum LB1]